jgi:hypothetical protein
MTPLKATAACLIFAAISPCFVLGQSNPTYSVALYLHQDPGQYLFDAETQMNQAIKVLGHPFPPVEVMAAKAALEAGDNAKALAYATEAFATAQAREADRKKRGFKEAWRHDGIAKTYYYANFVFGRLAILKGDIRSAEQYLLASGQTPGGPVINSYGPNLSLALELLKNGDAESQRVVVQFIEEIRAFWHITPAPFDSWISQIKANKVPDFNSTGSNLYY